MIKKLVLTLIIIGFLVYFNSLFNTFLWDDEEFVTNNTPTQSIKNISLFFIGNTPGAEGSVVRNTSYYRPIISTIYSIMLVLSKGSPFYFRLLQITIHIINAALIFFLFLYFFNQSYFLTLFLSLVFLVHPINSEAVLFISATQEVLFFCVGMSAVLFLTKKKNIKIHTLLLTDLLLTTSLFIKETGIVFFGIIFFYLALFNKRYLLKYLIITILFIWAYLFIRLIVGSTYVQGQGLFPIMRTSFFNRLMTIPSIILFYLTRFIFPNQLAIARHWVVGSPDFYNFFLPLFLIGTMIVSAALFIIKTKNKTFAFFFAWFLIGLLPHLQLIPLNMTVAERWFYFPMVGLLGMIGVAISNIKYPSLVKTYIVGLIIVCLLSTRTIVRTFDWRNGLALFSHDIKISKNAFDLENNLGVELFRTGKTNQAKIYFENSTKLAPYWWVNWNNLGAVYEKEKNLKKAEELYKKSIDNGDYYLAYENYANVLIKENKTQAAKQFLERKALVKFPNNQRLNELYRYIFNKN